MISDMFNSVNINCLSASLQEQMFDLRDAQDIAFQDQRPHENIGATCSSHLLRELTSNSPKCLSHQWICRNAVLSRLVVVIGLPLPLAFIASFCLSTRRLPSVGLSRPSSSHRLRILTVGGFAAIHILTHTIPQNGL